jgi:F0F1-type ATP synthase gamma subunit
MALDQKSSPNDELVVLGERGARYFEDVDEKFTLFPGIPDEIDGNYASGIRDFLIEGYKRRFGKIILIYPEFVSLTVQHVKRSQLLPTEAPMRSAKPVSKLQMESMLIEPSGGIVLRALVELWLGFKLWEVFWSSKQSEYAARIMHLEGSTQELTQINKNLSLEYFRQVHMMRDKVIREISASKLLVGKK